MPHSFHSSISELASECVRCGLCLPHCPTYQIGRKEPESPRGRIQMLAAFAQQELDWQPSLQQHVDQCLSCGHCERVCPIPVSYEKLLVQGRELLAQKHSVTLSRKMAIKIIEIPYLRNLCFKSIHTLQKLYLWKLFQWCANKISKRLGRITAFVPVPIHAYKFVKQKNLKANVSFAFFFRSLFQKWVARRRGPRRAQLVSTTGCRSDRTHFCKLPQQSAKLVTNLQAVLLFPGCTGENLGHSTFDASKQLLRHLGFQIYLPPKIWCCGALSGHGGLGTDTREKTLDALNHFCAKKNIEHIITFATGCGGWMNSHDIKIIDIQQFLLDHWPENYGYFSMEKEKKWRIAVHSPCTQTNALKKANLSFDLLSKIPELELIRFGENTCCGAAGTYMVDHPEISDALIKQLLTPNLLENCDAIVTSNIGCQLQFQHHLKSQKKEQWVCHPVEICLQYVSRTNFSTTNAPIEENTANDSAIR